MVYVTMRSTNESVLCTVQHLRKHSRVNVLLIASSLAPELPAHDSRYAHIGDTADSQTAVKQALSSFRPQNRQVMEEAYFMCELFVRGHAIVQQTRHAERHGKSEVCGR
jgi:hypothetical protein